MEREEGDGVVSMYPIISTDLQMPFVYEETKQVSALGAIL
jgi:hypothetical protein